VDDIEIEFLDEEELPHHPPPLTSGRFRQHGRPEADPVAVLIHQRVLTKTQDHARRSPTVEIGGMLVGRVYRHKGRLYTEVSDYVFSATPTAEQGDPVRFEFSTTLWAELNRLSDIHHKGLRMVGWFHSHPGHGIFLSNPDLDVHRKVAYQPWQIALVYDPQRHQGGVFGWYDDEVKPFVGFYELYAPGRSESVLNWSNIRTAARESNPPDKPKAEPTKAQPVALPAPAAPPPQVSLQPPRRGVGRALLNLLAVLSFIALAVLSYFVILRVIESNRLAQETRLVATRLADEAQIRAVQTTLARGDADATAAFATIGAQVLQLQAAQTAAAMAQTAAATAQLWQLANAQTQEAQMATLQALLTVPASPTLAVVVSPTSTPTPEGSPSQPSAPEPPTVPVTPLLPTPAVTPPPPGETP
jgi:proteasome lid subunit RPN8/RPN11